MMAAVERVTSSPQMGVTSAFCFGRGLGVVDGVIAALGWSVEYVAPRVWKKAFGIRVGAGKDDSRAKASQLLPLDTGLWTPRRGVVNSAQAVGRAAALIAYSRRDNSDRRRRGRSHRRRSRASQDW